jgi:hypothetical protein
MSLHENREELHGITVVMAGVSGKTYLGRFHETTERGVAMRDLGVHDPGTSEHDLPAWIDRARQFGIAVEHRLLVVPTGEVGSIVRLSEWKGER